MSLCYGKVSGEPSVLIADAALSAMFGLRQTKARDKEAGGQLFAHFDGSDVVIVEATPPNLLDRRSRYNFKPNRLLQRREIRKKHAAGLHFVGDWHTHPETTATPSGNDLTSMQDCFRRSRHDLTAFILIVVGIVPPPEGWYVALVTADGVQRLSSIASDPDAAPTSIRTLSMIAPARFTAGRSLTSEPALNIGKRIEPGAEAFDCAATQRIGVSDLLKSIISLPCNPFQPHF